MNPMVSVVVPSYNHSKYIKKTIDSINNQTYSNIELIVIDDGSTDDSIDIIKNLTKEYNFHFIHQKNIGLTATLNKSLTIAKGKYICFLASDDYWPTNKIEIQVNFLEENPQYYVCYGKMIAIDQDDTILHCMDYKDISGNIFESIFISNIISAPTAMINMAVFDIVGKYDETLPIEDLYMWLKIAEKFQIGFIDEYLAYYRFHENNTFKKIEMMLETENKIVSMFSYRNDFKTLYAKWNLEKFHRFAKINKKLAIKYMLNAKSMFFTKRFRKGLIKLIFKWRLN